MILKNPQGITINEYYSAYERQCNGKIKIFRHQIFYQILKDEMKNYTFDYDYVYDFVLPKGVITCTAKKKE
jgi:hypothetical protein